MVLVVLVIIEAACILGLLVYMYVRAYKGSKAICNTMEEGLQGIMEHLEIDRQTIDNKGERRDNDSAPTFRGVSQDTGGYTMIIHDTTQGPHVLIATYTIQGYIINGWCYTMLW